MSSLFLLFMLFKITLSCHTFTNTKLTVRANSGEYTQITVTGCIERKTLPNITATEIEVKGEKIPHLRKDDVRHLTKLLSISFEDCQIWEIEPDLFRNVPSLRLVKIAFNDLIEVKKDVFSTLPSLEVLNLSNNNFDRVEDGAFGNSTKLREIYCDHNRLEEWREEWFNGSVNVEVMDFRFNRIHVLKSFAKFPKLREVRFDHNELVMIQPELFKGVRRLHYLGLRFNRLTEIDQKIFHWDFSINTLSIGANYLNYIPRRVLAKITVKELELQGNPWKCPCLDQIFNWLYETNGTCNKQESCSGRQIPVCVSPSLYPYSCLEKRDEEATELFFGNLKTLYPPLDKYCARLD